MSSSRVAVRAALLPVAACIGLIYVVAMAVLAVPLFMGLLAMSSANALLARRRGCTWLSLFFEEAASAQAHTGPGAASQRVQQPADSRVAASVGIQDRGLPEHTTASSLQQKRGAQPLTLDIPRAAISEEPMKVPTAAAVEGTAVKATQSLSPIPPLQQPSAAPGDAASTTKAMSPVGWRAISPRSTPHAADSPSSSTCSTSGPPSPPTPLRPEAAVGEAARADPASQRQSQASVAGTAGDNRAPQPVLDGALLATCRPLSLLGEGSFGTVHRVRVAPKSGPSYEAARKRIPVHSDYVREQFEAEVEALKAGLGCVNVVQILDARSTPYYHEILMELLRGGTLEDELSSTRYGRLPEPRVKALALDTLRGLADLHARRVCCRDIKLENIMLRQKGGQAVLVDLGMAVKTDADGRLGASCGIAGSMCYMAPELYEGTAKPAAGAAKQRKGGRRPVPPRITVKSDVFSLGQGLLECAVRGGVDVDRVASVPLREFLRALVANKPEERLSAEEALRHPYLAAVE